MSTTVKKLYYMYDADEIARTLTKIAPSLPPAQTAELLEKGIRTGELVFIKKFNKKKLSRSMGKYSFFFTRSKLKELFNTREKLRKMGFKVEDTLILKAFINNTKVIEAVGEEKGDYVFFKVKKKEWEQWRGQEFTVIVRFSDDRIIKLLRLIKKHSLVELLQQSHSHYNISIDEIVENVITDTLNKKNNEQPPVQPQTAPPAPAEGQADVVDDEYYSQLREKAEETINIIVKNTVNTYNNTVRREGEPDVRIETFKEFRKLYLSGELGADFLEKKYTHIRQMYKYMQMFIDYLEKNRMMLDREPIKQYFTLLLQKYSKNTVEHHKTALSYLFRRIDREDLIGAIDSVLKLNKDSSALKKQIRGINSRFWTVEDVRKVLFEIDNNSELTDEEKDELIGLIALLFTTGGRVTETLRIRVKDIDFWDRVGIIRPDSSKTNTARPIFLTPEVRDYLTWLLKKYNRTSGDDYLFNRGLRIFRNPKQGRATQRLKEAGININLKDLRKTFSTYLNNFSEKTLSSELENIIAGHTREIVQKHYNLTEINLYQIFLNRQKEEFRALYSLILQKREQYDTVARALQFDSIIPAQIKRRRRLQPPQSL